MIIETHNNIRYLKLLERIYSYLLKGKCSKLQLQLLKKITVDYKNELPSGVGARYVNGKVYVAERDIKNALCNIRNNNFEKYIKDIQFTEDNATKLLIDNIMHELFHYDAHMNMPHLHKINCAEKADDWERCVSHFWIECTVEYNSRSIAFLQNEKLLKQISEAEWHINCFYDNKDDFGSMYYLIYSSAYFIALSLVLHTGNKYLECISDSEIRELYTKLLSICKPLLSMNTYTDNYKDLKGIEKIFKDCFEKLHVK